MSCLKGRLVGYLVGSQFGDFLAHMRSGPGWNYWGYCESPGAALQFKRFVDAKRVACDIDKPGYMAVPLYDRGDKWVVAWPLDHPVFQDTGQGPPRLIPAL